MKVIMKLVYNKSSNKKQIDKKFPKDEKVL